MFTKVVPNLEGAELRSTLVDERGVQVWNSLMLRRVLVSFFTLHLNDRIGSGTTKYLNYQIFFF